MRRWMTAALCGLALVSAAPAADARDGFTPHAMFHVAPMARAPGFGIARGPRFEHRDRAALLDGFPEVSGPIVPCSDYNPWVSVPPYPMTCD